MTLDIQRMLEADAYDHPVDAVELVETHISWVLLTGTYAYKIKKPVDFGFLDFSSLERRLGFCREELRLNRRLAPGLYIDVVAITGSRDRPKLGAAGEAIEYAVKMRQFPQQRQLDNLLHAGELDIDQFDAIAAMAARFHAGIPVAGAGTAYGEPDSVLRPALENVSQIRAHTRLDITAILDGFERWIVAEFERLRPTLEARKRDGHIRECHGDMHLRNLLWLDDGPVAFDCIEFNPNLRWIDVISEIAFLVMDLQDRQQPGFANRFLNTYLESTGDYAGLEVLRFYLCYRALVRAKVDALSIEQHGDDEQARAAADEFMSYIELARSYTRTRTPRLIVMRGLSASGKSTVSQRLIDATGAVRIRSDVERKRLFGIDAAADAATDVDAGIYAVDASRRTYARLAELAGGIVRAGYSVIVDAACLHYDQRELFRQLGQELGVACILLEVSAPVEELRRRILARPRGVSDAGLPVLEHQLLDWRPLRDEELAAAVTVDTSRPYDIDELAARILAG